MSVKQLSSQTFQFKQIGVIHSCYRQKFGIPRQPGLVTAAEATLELLPPYNQENLVRGLDGFSHIWVHFIFHQTMAEGWRPTIRPPKLGGKRRVGVFATRSTHRPNHMGMSVVQLRGIESGNGQLMLHLVGVDILDGTPVIDIKPYLPYADAFPNAESGFAQQFISEIEVKLTDEAVSQCLQYEQDTGRKLIQLIKQVISQDPRPAYLVGTSERRHVTVLWDVSVIWEYTNNVFLVKGLEPVK